MTGRIILGVDPGLQGALAIYAEDAPEKLAVFDMPVLAGEVQAPIIVDLLKLWPIDLAVIEDVHAMPKQGVSSSFNFGKGFGVVLGVIGALGIRSERVPPSKWKRHFRLSRDKDESRQSAIRLFPQRAALFARKKDDGRAEAALIALWGSDNL